MEKMEIEDTTLYQWRAENLRLANTVTCYDNIIDAWYCLDDSNIEILIVYHTVTSSGDAIDQSHWCLFGVVITYGIGNMVCERIISSLWHAMRLLLDEILIIYRSRRNTAIAISL